MAVVESVAVDSFIIQSNESRNQIRLDNSPTSSKCIQERRILRVQIHLTSLALHIIVRGSFDDISFETESFSGSDRIQHRILDQFLPNILNVLTGWLIKCFTNSAIYERRVQNSIVIYREGIISRYYCQNAVQSSLFRIHFHSYS